MSEPWTDGEVAGFRRGFADVIAPLAVWDTTVPGWPADKYWLERITWAQEHIDRAIDTYRVEFCLLDTPYAIVYRYQRNGNTLKFRDPETGELAIEEPVVQLLGGLPPEHLLTIAPAAARDRPRP